MKNAVIEKPEFPGASTVEPVRRLMRRGIRAASTAKTPGLRHANATIFPYEDEDAGFKQHRYYFGKPNGNREVIALPESEDETWTEAKNQRRCDLIDRKYAGSLTPAETVELAELQEQMLRHRQRVAPLPLEDARRLHHELLTRASGSQLPTGKAVQLCEADPSATTLWSCVQDEFAAVPTRLEALYCLAEMNEAEAASYAAEQFARPDLPEDWRHALVFFAESVHFPPPPRQRVGEQLLAIAMQLRFSTRAGVEKVVWAAMRRGLVRRKV